MTEMNVTSSKTPRRPGRLAHVACALVATVGVGPLVGACSDAGATVQKAGPAAAPPREVNVWTLEPTDVRRTGTYLGSLLSRESVTVMPQVNGYVSKIHVRPGQHVKAGDPLMDIDSRQESAALDSAVAQQTSAETTLELARTTLARTEALYREGLVSAQELEKARSDVQAAQAAARAARAAVSQRKVQLQFHTIRAAVPGVVGEVEVRVGANVNANTKLTTIAQADVLELTVGIPAQRARELPPAAPMEIIDEAGNVLVTTTSFYVAPEADPKTQLVEVKAVFENRYGFLPSELVRVRVVYGVDRTLVVPAPAIVRMSGQPFVFAVFERDGATIVERRPVTLGELGQHNYVLEGGLKEGDRVAVSSIQALRDRMPIRPVPVTLEQLLPKPTTKATDDADKAPAR